VTLVVAGATAMRVEIAKQRRAVATARARLAAAKVRRRAEDVPVVVIQQVGKSVARVSRQAAVALAEDGLYCLSSDGAWGGRVRVVERHGGDRTSRMAAGCRRGGPENFGRRVRGRRTGQLGIGREVRRIAGCGGDTTRKRVCGDAPGAWVVDHRAPLATLV